MSRIVLGLLAFLVVTVAPAYADDPNRWQGWVTPVDGQDNGVDVSMVTGDPSTCKKPWVALQPRYRNRYQDHISGKLKIDSEGTDGARSTLTDFDLQAGETKTVAAAAFCHDSRKSLAFSIAELHFPERDAERAKLEAQKAAAAKAAADAAAARKAAAERAAADAAAAEAARREQTQREAAELAKRGEEARQRELAARQAGERDVAAQREQQRAAEEYQQRRQHETQSEADASAPVNDLAGGELRHGELSAAAALGFQSVDYGAASEGRFSYGLRASLRAFSWLRKTSAPGELPTGNGFEIAIAGGIARTLDLRGQGSSTKTSTNLAGGSLHARYWNGSLGVGLFGEWNRFAHSIEGGMSSTDNLFALGPELALGLVASRAIALEASVRVGGVASGNGLSFSASDDLFVGATVVAEINRFYAGAYATRYVTTGSLPTTWNAIGMLGARLPF